MAADSGGSARASAARATDAPAVGAAPGASTAELPARPPGPPPEPSPGPSSGQSPNQSPGPSRALPSFAELEAAGATIGQVRVSAQQIFDAGNPLEDHWLFRLANRLHIPTRPEVIERALLFKPGQRVSAQAIEETERLLRANNFLYDVQIRALAVHDGVVDIEVLTRDTWSLDPGISASRQGGVNTGGIRLAEYNLLGTGVSLRLGRSRDVDRTSREFALENPRAFGTWASLRLAHRASSDGGSDSIYFVRPFYRLDARWAAGVSALRGDEIDSVYSGGAAIAQFRHRQRRAEVFGGLSHGLVEGWVRRASIGVWLREDRYAVVSGLAAPSQLPADQHLVAPFVRLELLEDRYERQLNRNLIGQPEFFALGLRATLEVGAAMSVLGSDASGALYAATLSRGFEPIDDRLLMTAASLSGQYLDGRVQRQRLGLQAQFYLRQSPRWLFYASVASDTLTRPALEDLATLGGDSGLRGYPLRYQSGTRRALATVEERFYTDLYVWQLFRIGGAAYMDYGRAWGGALAGSTSARWLGNFGLGLRIVSTRSAFSNVLHVDLAFPVRAPADVSRMQFLVKTKTSF